MRKNTKTILIIVTGSLVFVVATSIFFTYMLLGKIGNINDKVKQMEISTLERNKQGAQKMSVVNTEIERAKLESYFISVDGDIDFIKYLEKLSVDAGVKTTIQNINFEPLNDAAYKNTAEYISLNLNSVGSWLKIYNFVLLLEKLPYVSRVTSVELGLDSQNPTKNQTSWKASITLKVVKLKSI